MRLALRSEKCPCNGMTHACHYVKNAVLFDSHPSHESRRISDVLPLSPAEGYPAACVRDWMLRQQRRGAIRRPTALECVAYSWMQWLRFFLSANSRELPLPKMLLRGKKLQASDL